MIKLDVNGKEFKIANSYDELTMGQYSDIKKIGENKEQYSDTNDITVKLLSLLSDKPKELEDIMWNTFTLEDLNQFSNHFDWVSDSSAIEELKNLKPKEFVMINNKKYGVVNNFNNLNLLEVRTFEELFKHKVKQNIHEYDLALAILLRPLDDNGKLMNFTTEIFDEVYNNRYNVLMKDVYATICFFLSGETISPKKNTNHFSIQVI